MKTTLLTAIIFAMNCSGNPLESRIEPSSKAKEQDILKIDANFEKTFPAIGGEVTYTLCKVGQHVAVIIKAGGSGAYVYSMRIYVMVEKGWGCVKSSNMSTGSAKKTPEKVTLNQNVVTILSRDDKIIDSFDVSGYLD